MKKHSTIRLTAAYGRLRNAQGALEVAFMGMEDFDDFIQGCVAGSKAALDHAVTMLHEKLESQISEESSDREAPDGD